MFLKHLIHLLWVEFLIFILSTGQVSAGILTRQKAIQVALEYNPEVIAAQKEWDAARARVYQARALPDPELKMEYEELPGKFLLGKFGERNIGFTQRIEFPLKWWLRNRAVSLSADAVRMSAFEMTKLEVATKVKVTYDRVLLGIKILEYTEQNLKFAQNFLQKAMVRFEAGDVPQLDVLRAEVEVGRAENRVTVTRNALSVSRAELNTLLVRDIQIPFEVNGELVYHPLEIDLDRLKDISLERRPDLLGSEITLSAVQARRSTVLSSVVPDLNLGIFRQTIGELTNRQGFWHVSFGLEIPLWAMFRQRGEIAEASAEVSRAKADKDAIHFQVLLEVERAFLNLKAAGAQVRLFQKRTLRVAERAYEMASRSYQEGKATYLELLDAQRVLTETRVEYVEALFDYRSSLATLERSIGGDIAGKTTRLRGDER